MKILALEFSSPQRSAAVLDSGADGAALNACEVVEAGAGPMNALAMVDEVLRQAKLERGAIEVLAIGLGPGSYTGIRGVIALAQGWQLARDVRLTGLSSVECVAAGAQAEGVSGSVTVVLDAQRNEFYLARYEIDGAAWSETEALRLATLAEARESASTSRTLIGPEATRWFPAGRVVFPRAAMLARLAARRNDFVRGETLEPIYLRETAFVKASPPRIVS